MKTKRLTARLTAFALALLMITSGMVFGVGAEEEATDESTTETTTTATAPTIVPVSDCDSTDHWYTDKQYIKDAALKSDTEIYTQGTGSISLSFTGIYDDVGALQWTWKNTNSPLDITGMKVLHFDLYLENAAAVANAKFDVELRDADHVDAVKVDNQWYEYEANGQFYLCDLIVGEIREGWNTVEIPLSSLNVGENSKGKYDMTKIAYFRMFSSNPGKNTATGLYGAPWNIIGTDGKTTTVKLDNVYFASEPLAKVETDALILIEGGDAGKSAKLTSASGTAVITESKTLETAQDISGKQYLELDVYISDVSLAGKTRFDIELTSAGKADSEEDGWGNVSLSTLAELSGVTLAKGWNHLKVALNDRSVAGNLKMEKLNFFRIFSREGANAKDKDEAEQKDNEASTEENKVTDNIDGYYKKNFKEDESCYVVLGRVMLTGSTENENKVLITTCESATGNVKQFGSKNRSGDALQDVDNDNVKEWVWFNSSNSYTLEKGNDFAWLMLTPGKLPYCKNFSGVTFEIWMSDAMFAEKKFNIEFTSSGGCDHEEREGAHTLNSLAGTTLKAEEWQTVTIPLSKLTGENGGEFDPIEFDYMRFYTNYDCTFENGLTVAVRNIYALNYGTQTSEIADGILNMENASDFTGQGYSLISLTGVDGNPENHAAPMINAKAGEVLANNSGNPTWVNDMPLSQAINISKCDWMSFDLYLENFSSWGDKVKFLMGLSSSGTCDYQQITSSGKTIKTMFGGHVVNADGTKGTLKDGWNHIELPIYELFSDYVSSKVKYSGNIGDHKTGDVIEDENYKGSFRPAKFNYLRSYVQTNKTLEGNYTINVDAVAAIDNIKFFDGDTVGTRDDKVIYNEEGITIYDSTESYAEGVRVALTRGWPMDASATSGKVALQMDVYVEKMAEYTAKFNIEISSYDNIEVTDQKEDNYCVSMQTLGAVEGQWTTIRISLDEFTKPSGNNADRTNITRISIYNMVGALPAGYVLKVRNVGFVTETVKTGIISAQPSLTESIDFTTKAKLPASSPAAFEYVLGSDKNMTRVMSRAWIDGDESNDKYTVYTAQFTDIHAHRMADTLTMTLWTLDENNKLVKAESKDYSVRQYATNMITKCSNDTALVALLSDMLTYGAAVQLYGTYRTDDLANKVTGVTLNPTVGEFTVPSQTATLTGNSSEGGPEFYSASLVLGGTVKIRVKFEADSVENLVLTANGGVQYKFQTFQKSGDYYYVDIPVYARQFNSEYGGYGIWFNDNTGYCLTYSVGAYVAKMYKAEEADTAGSLSSLLVALTNYGNSAAAYDNATSGQ